MLTEESLRSRNQDKTYWIKKRSVVKNVKKMSFLLSVYSLQRMKNVARKRKYIQKGC